MKVYEKHSVSEHIKVSALPGAVEKGNVVVLGGLVGVADYSAAAGTAGSISVGVPVAVFSAAIAAAGFTPVVGGVVYATAAGGLSQTAEGNIAFGTVTRVDAETFDFARL
jgi:predicted RecA/RadA family phage recombinase